MHGKGEAIFPSYTILVNCLFSITFQHTITYLKIEFNRHGIYIIIYDLFCFANHSRRNMPALISLLINFCASVVQRAKIISSVAPAPPTNRVRCATSIIACQRHLTSNHVNANFFFTFLRDQKEAGLDFTHQTLFPVNVLFY